jgi:uncharacterized membrane protein
VSYPVESVPDGSILAPHHLYVGAFLALLVCAVVWDNYPGREPVVAVAALLVALFGFLWVWPFYPATGATLTLAGLVAALLAVLVRGSYWTDVPIAARLTVLLGVLIALDDAADHALPITTPLDHVGRVLLPLLP